MNARRIVLSLCLVFIAQSASAATLWQACARDYKAVCSGKPTFGRVVACLSGDAAMVSPGCWSVLQAVKDPDRFAKDTVDTGARKIKAATTDKVSVKVRSKTRPLAQKLKKTERQVAEARDSVSSGLALGNSFFGH